MNPGKLRHRVRLETSTGGAGWTEVATVPAAVVPLTGSQWILARGREGGGGTPTHRVEIRYRVGLPSPLRAIYGTRTLNVLSVADVDERHEELHLFCEEHR